MTLRISDPLGRKVPSYCQSSPVKYPLSVLSTWARFYNQDATRKWPPRILAMVDRLVYGEHMSSAN